MFTRLRVHPQTTDEGVTGPSLVWVIVLLTLGRFAEWEVAGHPDLARTVDRVEHRLGAVAPKQKLGEGLATDLDLDLVVTLGDLDRGVLSLGGKWGGERE